MKWRKNICLYFLLRSSPILFRGGGGREKTKRRKEEKEEEEEAFGRCVYRTGSERGGATTPYLLHAKCVGNSVKDGKREKRRRGGEGGEKA